MPRQRIDFLGTKLDAITLNEAVEAVDGAIACRRPMINASLNAAKVVRLQRDSILREAIAACDLITADGVPIVWAGRLLGLRVPERVNGTDLMETLLARAEERGYSVFFLGARPDVLEDACAEVARRHPSLSIAGARHGYFVPSEEKDVVADVAAAAPDILFVALETPQKELFPTPHREALGVPFAMGVGGSLDVLAGRRRRAPLWAQRAGLEWLFRLGQEPRRLFRRYLIGNSLFLALLGRELARTRLGLFSPERLSDEA
jgi:N-acetylglucosaminyldiphosphoundecaprenol N-acetyl-beta-D-mannosaminyltransferase